MLRSLINGGDPRSLLVSLMLSLPIIMLALSVHETAHGYVASKLGDPTARSLGRLSLNPLKHLDPIGFICMMFFGFGWAKPVPINTRYFKKPKRDMALTGAAGPISNLLLATIFALLYKLLFVMIEIMPPTTNLIYNIYFWTEVLFYLGISMNVTLAAFNLIPLPPLDGSRIFFALLPSGLYFKVMRYERYIYFGFLIALATGILDRPIDFIVNIFMRLFNLIIF